MFSLLSRNLIFTILITGTKNFASRNVIIIPEFQINIFNKRFAPK